MTDEIGGVKITAPLWRNASSEDLHAIVECLSSASYHYADDSSKEWGKARQIMKDAAAKVNALGLGHYGMKCLHKHTPQLVSFDQFVDAVLDDARTGEKA